MPERMTDARKEYEQGALDEAGVDHNPIRQFTSWYDAAVAAAVPEPEAMTLSTATAAGRPSARIVLLRGYDDRGFCFFSNYTSHKGREGRPSRLHDRLVFSRTDGNEWKLERLAP